MKEKNKKSKPDICFISKTASLNDNQLFLEHNESITSKRDSLTYRVNLSLKLVRQCYRPFTAIVIPYHPQTLPCERMCTLTSGNLSNALSPQFCRWYGLPVNNCITSTTANQRKTY